MEKSYTPNSRTRILVQLFVWIAAGVGLFSCSKPANDWHYQSLLHPPEILFTPLAGPYRAGESLTLSWTLTAFNTLPTQSFTVEVSSDGGKTWQNAGKVAISTSSAVSSYPYSFTWITPAWNTTQAMFRVSYADSLGIPGQGQTESFTIDSTAPTLNSAQLKVNNSVASSTTTTTSNYFSLSFGAQDNLTNITHYCLKYYNATAPSLTDSCWIAVNNGGAFSQNPSLSLSLSGYPYNVGFITGSYTIKVWVRDAAGNISSNSASPGTDAASILFVQYPPPSVINTVATNTDTPNSPPTSAQLTLLAGSTLHIKWNAAAGAGTSLAANPISIYYTTDDVNYTLIASNLTNAGQGGCTVTAGKTGCYAWTPGNLSTSYFRVRVTAQDLNGQITAQGSIPLNVSSAFKFLAGNVDPGLNASATAAMFFNYSQPSFTDSTAFVVSSSGDVYFRDLTRGILKVSPSDGIQRIFIPISGTSSGDGGAATSATVSRPYKLALDGFNRLLIFDNDRIRRVDLGQSTPTITTIIGTGASTADGVTGLNVSITSPGSTTNYFTSVMMPFAALQNGDVIFQSEAYFASPLGGSRIRRYQNSTGLVSSVYFTGTGFTGYPAQDITQCTLGNLGIGYDSSSFAFNVLQGFAISGGASCTYAASGTFTPVGFDPLTGAAWSAPYLSSGFGLKITGNDGNLYATSGGSIGKYDASSKTWTILAGTGTRGSCSDGTQATSCNINAYDVFVNSQGQVFFIDAGRLRVIDPSTTQIVTLMGQSFFFGDGGDPLSARFQFTDSFDLLNSGDIIVMDRGTYRFRQFTSGGTISTIAGNGTAATSADTVTLATSQGIVLSGDFYSPFAANPTNGDIFYTRATGRISRLDRATNLWVDTVGAGATSYTAGDGQAGANIGGFHHSLIVGYDGTNILAGLDVWTGSAFGNTYLKSYNTSAAWTQSNVAGIVQANNTATTYCGAGVAQASCGVPYVTRGGNYLYNTYDSFSSRWVFLAYGGTSVIGMPAAGPTVSITTLAYPAIAYAYVHTAGANMVYYCSSTDGKLHKKDITAATDTVYSWPISDLQCTGSRLIYDSSTSTLIFSYTQNGLYGIAAYTAP